VEASRRPLASTAPPAFLALAAHPVRWRLLTELAYSDRKVGELTRLVDEPQSLVSYHLGRLRAGGLVSPRRSAADSRASYWCLDLARCGVLLAAAAGSLHPGLRLVAVTESQPAATRRARVLFLCTGNSARSQMAQALLEHLSDGTVTAVSAGSHPKPLHPNAVRAMNEWGIDIADRRPRHLRRFARQRFDYVVSLCDRVREVCPEFPGGPQLIHWSIADPARDPSEDTYPAFRRTAEELDSRCRFLLHLIQRPLEVT